MEKLKIKFSISPKELFFINVFSSIKTMVIVLILGGILGLVSAMVYGADQVLHTVNWKNYYEGIFVLSMLIIGAGLAYQLITDVFVLIKILINKKSNPTMFGQRIITIDEEKGIILYSDDKKDGVKWGYYKFFYETKKYLVLRNDVNNMFFLKKAALSAEELKWFMQNLKTQNLIEYRKKMEARRNR